MLLDIIPGKKMHPHPQKLRRVLKEIVEYSEELYIAIEGMSKNLNDKNVLLGRFFDFNYAAEELKHRFWIVQKVFEAEYFDENKKSI